MSSDRTIKIEPTRVTVYTASGMALWTIDESEALSTRWISEEFKKQNYSSVKFNSLTKELEELIESSPELKEKFMDWLESWSGYYEVEFEVDMDP